MSIRNSIAQRTAEGRIEATRRGGGPFVTAADTTRMPMLFSDPKRASNPIVYANDSFLLLTGYERGEALGNSYRSLIGGPHGDPTTGVQIETAFGDDASEDYPEIQYHRKDGSRFWATVLIEPVLDENGVFELEFASFVDVTERRMKEARLRFLLEELSHRTQNTLATVQAIAVETLGGVVDREAYDSFEGRLLALSEAHSLLGREHSDGANLRDVATRILEPFGFENESDGRILVRGTDLKLHHKAAISLAMMFQELATNAAKYGALSQAGEGKIDLSWTVEPARLRILWEESGGPPVSPPTYKSFGTDLIERSLPRNLHGDAQIEYRVTGVVCLITVPLGEYQ